MRLYLDHNFIIMHTLITLALNISLIKYEAHESIQRYTWRSLNPFISFFSCGHIEQIFLIFLCFWSRDTPYKMGFILLISFYLVSFLTISISYPDYSRLRSSLVCFPFLCLFFSKLFYLQKPEYLFPDITTPSVSVSMQSLLQGSGHV